MRKQLFYHGSPVKGIKILKPKLDPRLGIKGVFIANEPFTPMLFSLLPSRAKSMVNSITKNGKFIRGEVISPFPLNEEGYLYIVKPNKKYLIERKPGKYYVKNAVKVLRVKIVKKEKVLKMGWKVKVKTV